MSTFEGRQITQLICRKPVNAADATTTTSSAHADAGMDVDTDTAPAGLSSQEQDEKGGEGGRGSGRGEGGGGESSSGFDTRERGEAFMCISLEVKNMLGVEDALEKFTEKEIIEGYAWDEEVGDVFFFFVFLVLVLAPIWFI